MVKRAKSGNFYIGVVVFVISITALLVGIFSQNSVKTLEKGTPESIVQSYLQSITDGRNDLAATNFSIESKCTVEDIDRTYIESEIDVNLVKTVIEDKVAIVTVTIQRSYSIFEDSSNQEEQTFRLNLEKGEWKITGIPWPLYDCGGFLK
jgi:hypothetical protein